MEDTKTLREKQEDINVQIAQLVDIKTDHNEAAIPIDAAIFILKGKVTAIEGVLRLQNMFSKAI